MTPKDQLKLLHKIRDFMDEFEYDTESDIMYNRMLILDFVKKFGDDVFNDNSKQTRKTEREVKRLFNAMNKRLMMFA